MTGSRSNRPLTPRPIWTEWALRAFRVIDTFFVWASQNAGTGHDGLHAVLLKEGKHLMADRVIIPYVGGVGEPSFQLPHLGSFAMHDANRDLGRVKTIWAIERDCPDRVAAKAPLSLASESVMRCAICHSGTLQNDAYGRPVNPPSRRRVGTMLAAARVDRWP